MRCITIVVILALFQAEYSVAGPKKGRGQKGKAGGGHTALEEGSGSGLMEQPFCGHPAGDDGTGPAPSGQKRPQETRHEELLTPEDLEHIQSKFVGRSVVLPIHPGEVETYAKAMGDHLMTKELAKFFAEIPMQSFSTPNLDIVLLNFKLVNSTSTYGVGENGKSGTNTVLAVNSVQMQMYADLMAMEKGSGQVEQGSCTMFVYPGWVLGVRVEFGNGLPESYDRSADSNNPLCIDTTIRTVYKTEDVFPVRDRMLVAYAHAVDHALVKAVNTIKPKRGGTGVTVTTKIVLTEWGPMGLDEMAQLMQISGTGHVKNHV